MSERGLYRRLLRWVPGCPKVRASIYAPYENVIMSA
ncbi:MAG: hypothetical protein ACJAZN_003306, partial [Planctomycetota bacterium]